MAARSRARYLAPVALVAIIAATVLIIRGATGSRHTGTRTEQLLTRTVVPAPAHSRSRPHAGSAVYVVRPGDSFSTISARTGVSIQTLESLNPSVNPQALQTGQRLRLRR